MPFIHPLFLPKLARKYIWGLYQVGGLALYTNAGLGTVNVPVRMNCPPEITMLTLRRNRDLLVQARAHLVPCKWSRS